MSAALVIGSGRMARIRLRVLLQDPGVEEVLLASRRRLGDAGELGAKVRPIGREEIAASSPGLAFVASATADHHDDAELALGLGCPVLCEKPLAHDTAAAERLVALAAERGRPLFVAFQRHFVPELIELGERLRGGGLGSVYHLRATHYDHTVGSAEFIATSGGIFKDQVVHDIECASWLTGSPVAAVFATASVRHWQDYAAAGDYDTATALLTMADGLAVTLQATRHHPSGQDVRVEAVGSEGAVAAGLAARTPIDSLDQAGLFGEDPPLSFEDAFAGAFDAETAAFTDFALGRSERFGGATAEAAVRALRVAEACERSVATGAPVAVEGVVSG